MVCLSKRGGANYKNIYQVNWGNLSPSSFQFFDISFLWVTDEKYDAGDDIPTSTFVQKLLNGERLVPLYITGAIFGTGTPTICTATYADLTFSVLTISGYYSTTSGPEEFTLQVPVSGFDSSYEVMIVQNLLQKQ